MSEVRGDLCFAEILSLTPQVHLSLFLSHVLDISLTVLAVLCKCFCYLA